jgi:PadR family transcriptional regulator PadR
MNHGARDPWVTQLRKGVLELLILNAISSEPCYGYDVARTLGELLGDGLHEGTVYPILSRLRREGLLRSSLEESPQGPPRKYYQLTADGRRELEQRNQAWDLLQQSIRSLRRRSNP